MTRKDEQGFPYAHDPIRINAIGDFIGETLIEMSGPGSITEAKLELLIEGHKEYSGMTNGEYWLAIMHAAAVLQAFALDKFTHLITDRDGDDDYEVEGTGQIDQSAKLAAFLAKVGADADLASMRDEMITLFPGITKEEWLRGFEMHDEAVLLDAAAASGVAISLKEEMAARGWGAGTSH
ncbi:hypothetical protein [Shinella sp.]|uniref:hypothetical protein n=1 Tax=Shinella sp. TaxID=1870904 RepID=UPI00258500D7|nr:hypothetical protein [Shinella sp.]MCW5706773.1 hypothetical protein [Shinella sp.]